MKTRTMMALLVMLAFRLSVQGQTATALNEGLGISYSSSTNSFTVSWWGRVGRTYFIQQSDDLLHWNYLPLIESGADDVISWGFSTTASRAFVRLRYTDIATSDPQNADFDGDGLSNIMELQNGSDPLASDSHGTGTPDGWAAGYGLEPGADMSLDGSNHLVFTYDDSGRVIQMAAPSTTAVGVVFDAEGNVTAVNQ